MSEQRRAEGYWASETKETWRTVYQHVELQMSLHAVHQGKMNGTPRWPGAERERHEHFEREESQKPRRAGLTRSAKCSVEGPHYDF